MRQVTKLAIHVTNLGSAYTFYGALGNGPNVSPRIKGATLRLQLSSDNEHWSNAWAAATSTSAGECMFHLTLTAGRTYYFPRIAPARLNCCKCSAVQRRSRCQKKLGHSKSTDYYMIPQATYITARRDTPPWYLHGLIRKWKPSA